MTVKQELIEVCKRHLYPAPNHVVIPEPYIPYIPDSWNGILVLAESQNLSDTNAKYREQLYTIRLDGTDKIYRRLELGAPNNLGVKPWDDDGYIKFALTVMYPNIRLEDTAVSNSIPWSRCVNGRNVNPSTPMEKHSFAFWKEIFEKWQPFWANRNSFPKIITIGSVSRRVMDNIEMKDRYLELVFPSPRVMNSVFSMFDSHNIKKMFPDLYERVELLYYEFSRRYSYDFKNKIEYMILYACHAVMQKEKFEGKLNKQRIIQILTANFDQIRNFSVSYLALFGSAVRDDFSIDSDIDILVDMRDKTFDNFIGLKLFLEQLFNRKVDLGLKDSIKPGFEKYILKEAEVVEGF